MDRGMECAFVLISMALNDVAALSANSCPLIYCPNANIHRQQNRIREMRIIHAIGRVPPNDERIKILIRHSHSARRAECIIYSFMFFVQLSLLMANVVVA